MALSSSSTLAEIQAQYDDNADYDVEGSTAKAKLFIEACRMLLRRMMEEVRKGGSSVRDAYQKIENQLDMAIEWWQENDTTTESGEVRVASFEYYR